MLLLFLLIAVPLVFAALEQSSVILEIKGMHCEGCAAGIEAMLKRTEGVIAAEVSFERNEANVTYDAAKTDPPKLVEAVEKLGYKVSVKK
jgi:copper chaperone CopZ